jgi:RNA polymerase sigma-70 factor, ECF subfamily
VPSLTEALALGLADAGREVAQMRADLASADLEPAIASTLAAGRRAWPSLPLAAEVFVRHLGRCLGAAPPEQGLHAALADCRAADLYVACAAGQGVEAAIEAISGAYLEGVSAAVRRVQGKDVFVQEVLQILRQKLFVAEAGAAPKILSFSGRAPLGVWLAAVAQKTALSALRADGAQADLKTRLRAEAAVAAVDPELRYIQARYAEVFEEAFRHALEQLSERGRALLRLHAFMGMTLEHLAGVYGVNDATISRWLAKARDDLLDHTGKYMRETHGVRPEEFPSLARVLTSQLDVSMMRLLGDPTDRRR